LIITIGYHIPCKQPKDNAHDYYNRKGFHSIALQGSLLILTNYPY